MLKNEAGSALNILSNYFNSINEAKNKQKYSTKSNIAKLSTCDIIYQ